jgi:hypothetical protein
VREKLRRQGLAFIEGGEGEGEGESVGRQRDQRPSTTINGGRYRSERVGERRGWRQRFRARREGEVRRRRFPMQGGSTRRETERARVRAMGGRGRRGQVGPTCKREREGMGEGGGRLGVMGRIGQFS